MGGVQLTKEEIEAQRAKEEKIIFSNVKKSKKVYINRDVDALLSNRISQKKGCVLFLHGQGGIGKSTLLEKFSQSDRPTIFIHINERVDMSMVDIFLDESKTTFYNCPKFEEKRYDIFISRENENKIPFNAEVELLQAIKEDFGEHGVFIVDTFEKNKGSTIQSRVKFDNNSIKFRMTDFHYQFRNYIKELVYIFVPHTTFIIAGRNRIDDVNENRSDERFLNIDGIEEIEMQNFLATDIEQYILGHKLPSPTKKQLSDIENLTNGNPLLVYLLIQVVKDYGSWSKLDYKEMQKIVYEDEDYGLIFYFTKRILSHIDIDDIWKLVIPRVLSQEIERLLFEEKRVFEALVDVGLLYRGKGSKRNIYRLHDDVAMAIESHAQKELGFRLASWHDHQEVARVHRELMEFYQACEDFRWVNREFEGCYHKIMLREGFEGEFEVSRGEFAGFVLGGVFTTYESKIETCQDIESLSVSDIKKMIDSYKSEKEALLSQMSQEFYEAVINHISKGKSSDGVYDISFLMALTKKKKFKKDDGIYYVLGIAYDNKKEYDKAIEAYRRAIEINPQKDGAYYNMGNAYDNKKEYDKAIEAYRRAVEINPQKDEAYNGMGVAYYSLGQFDEVIKALSMALHINPNDSSAYTNLFELQLTQNQPFDQTLEKKYIELFQNQKETFIQYEMLKILQDIVQNQEVNLEEWGQKYRGVGLGGWSFDELREWIDGFDEGEVKERLIEAIGVFEGHL